MVTIRSGRGLILALATFSVAGLSGCAEQIGPDAYAPYEAGVAAHVEEGSIVGSRPVSMSSPPTGAGAVIGGVTGAVVGGSIGEHRDRGAGSLVGALAGALVGTAIERDQAHQTGFAYTVRLRNTGELIEVAQADLNPIPNGVAVSVSYGARVRITPLAPPPVLEAAPSPGPSAAIPPPPPPAH